MEELKKAMKVRIFFARTRGVLTAVFIVFRSPSKLVLGDAFISFTTYIAFLPLLYRLHAGSISEQPQHTRFSKITICLELREI